MPLTRIKKALIRLTWHRLDKKEPANMQRCEYVLLHPSFKAPPPAVGEWFNLMAGHFTTWGDGTELHPIEAWGFSGDPRGHFVSEPRYTYWRPAPPRAASP